MKVKIYMSAVSQIVICILEVHWYHFFHLNLVELLAVVFWKTASLQIKPHTVFLNNIKPFLVTIKETYSICICKSKMTEIKEIPSWKIKRKKKVVLKFLQNLRSKWSFSISLIRPQNNLSAIQSWYVDKMPDSYWENFL